MLYYGSHMRGREVMDHIWEDEHLTSCHTHYAFHIIPLTYHTTHTIPLIPCQNCAVSSSVNPKLRMCTACPHTQPRLRNYPHVGYISTEVAQQYDELISAHYTCSTWKASSTPDWLTLINLLTADWPTRINLLTVFHVTTEQHHRTGGLLRDCHLYHLILATDVTNTAAAICGKDYGGEYRQDTQCNHHDARGFRSCGVTVLGVGLLLYDCIDIVLLLY